jgi:uncharacterized protein (TIGR02265 family)
MAGPLCYALPVEAMASIKGIGLVGIVKVLRALRKEAEAKVPQALQHYLNERVIVTEWYPEEDYRVLILTLGKLIADKVPGDVWEFLGEEGAKAQFGATYAPVVTKGDPVRTLKRAPMTWALYHNSGRVKVDIDHNGRAARVELHGYPIACPRICGSTTGYLRQLLVQSGARAPAVKMIACPRPEDGPVIWEAAWESDAEP